MNKSTVLLNEINDVLNDSEVKNNEQLTNILIQFKIKLENDEEYNLTCKKLSNAIVSYLNTNKFKAPKSVLKLYNSIANGESRYQGFLSIFNWI